jgi:hypothetical protein
VIEVGGFGQAQSNDSPSQDLQATNIAEDRACDMCAKTSYQGTVHLPTVGHSSFPPDDFNFEGNYAASRHFWQIGLDSNIKFVSQSGAHP